MISFLRGEIVDKRDNTVTIDAGGVGYELCCSLNTLNALGDVGSSCRVFVFSHYKTDGVSLYGFQTSIEKQLFLQLIKVDTIGPKSALNILQATSVAELIQLIDDGEAQALSKLPKISKKVADHLVVKLKGKLQDLRLTVMSIESFDKPIRSSRGRKDEVQGVLTHLGYRQAEVMKVLESIDDDVWNLETEDVVRHALGQLSGNL